MERGRATCKASAAAVALVGGREYGGGVCTLMSIQLLWLVVSKRKSSGARGR